MKRSAFLSAGLCIKVGPANEPGLSNDGRIWYTEGKDPDRRVVRTKDEKR